MATATRTRPNTFSALSNPNFRVYFAGQLVSTAGTWMQNVAQGFLVVQIISKATNNPQLSNLWLGLVAAAAGIPLVLLSPVSGVIVERVPRRRIMLVTQTTQMLLAFILAALTFANIVQVWEVIVLAFILGITNAVDQPSRQTFVVEVVGRGEMQSGIQLNSMLVSSSRVLGPTAAGVALVLVGAGWCFLLNGLSFLAVIASLLIMKVPYEIINKRTGQASPLMQMREGLAYARTNETILPLLLLTATVGFFSLPIIGFFAAFAKTVLNSPDVGYSVILVAQGIGSVLAGALVGWLSFRLGRGRLIGLAIGMGGIANFALSRQTQIPQAALFSLMSGLFIVSEVISLNTFIQSTVPDQFRGRVLSLYTLAFFGLSPFGALALGVVAGGVAPIAELFGASAAQTSSYFMGIGTANGLAIFSIAGVIVSGLILLRWPRVLQAE